MCSSDLEPHRVQLGRRGARREGLPDDLLGSLPLGAGDDGLGHVAVRVVVEAVEDLLEGGGALLHQLVSDLHAVDDGVVGHEGGLGPAARAGHVLGVLAQLELRQRHRGGALRAPEAVGLVPPLGDGVVPGLLVRAAPAGDGDLGEGGLGLVRDVLGPALDPVLQGLVGLGDVAAKIGRASCRERV